MENELSRVVDALPGLVWTALPDGRIDFLNQRWCEYTGLGVAEARGDGWRAAVHPEDLPDLLTRWKSIMASGEPGDMEARLRRFDGAYRWFLFRASRLESASGQSTGWCGINIDIEERKRGEEALRADENRFRLVVDGLPANITLRTPAGELLFANRHVLDFYGTTLDDMRGWVIGQSFHPDDRPGAIAARRNSVETGQPYDFETRIRRVDGVYRWFRMRGLPLRDTDGNLVLWYLLHADVDDQKRAEALLAGEKRLLEMVATGQSMPGILDALCQLVESTISGCFCGVVLADPSGTRLKHGAAPTLPAGFIASIIGRPINLDSDPCAMAVYRNEQVIAADLTSETRWAAYEWCPTALAHGLRACWSTPLASTTGKVLGAFAIYFAEPRAPTPRNQALIDRIRHIASIAIARAQSDADLKRSEAFLAETRRLSLTGGFSKRGATDEIMCSEEVHGIYEFDPGLPVTLERVLARIHPEDLPSVHELIDRQQSGADYEQEYRLLTPDHRVKHIHVVGHASQDPDGQLEYITVVQDVTARRLAEEAITKARSDLARVARVSSLGVVTASIAHEVNQPLSGIITNASTCLRMLAADPPNIIGARETARRTIRDGNRAADVIARLRALFAKKDATIETVDLNEVTREVIALALSELRRNRVIVRSELAESLPPVMGDRVQLQQVILNLMLNASDAMSAVEDRPRQMLIRTEQDGGDRVRLTVQDTGAGFEPQGAERLFEAFHTTKSGGMGIGLSVSRSIVENHHGRLWATPNDGPGAIFSFSIPGGADIATMSRHPDAMRPPVLHAPGNS